MARLPFERTAMRLGKHYWIRSDKRLNNGLITGLSIWYLWLVAFFLLFLIKHKPYLPWQKYDLLSENTIFPCGFIFARNFTQYLHVLLCSGSGFFISSRCGNRESFCLGANFVATLVPITVLALSGYGYRLCARARGESNLNHIIAPWHMEILTCCHRWHTRMAFACHCSFTRSLPGFGWIGLGWGLMANFSITFQAIKQSAGIIISAQSHVS